MTPTIPSPKRLWQFAAAALGVSALLLLAKRPDPPPTTQDTTAKRIAFCASVIDAIKSSDKTCGPYLAQAQQLLAQQKQAAQAAAEAARPKPVDPNGWIPSGLKGIYWRWCDSSQCSTSKVIGDNASVLAQVWCKERPCGDIYAQINLISDSGVVVGWTNDTAYGDTGQKVQLTFQSGQSGWSKARLTELKIGGMDAW